MLIDSGFTSLDTPLLHTSINLLDPRMRRLKSVQQLLKRRRQSIISLNSIRKEGITASIRVIKDIKKRRSRRLLLIRNIRMPRHRADTRLEELLVRLITRTSMHEMDLGMALWRTRRGVYVMTAEVAAELESFGDGEVGEVLVAEGDDFALGDVAG